jgi:hypothetical protein
MDILTVKLKQQIEHLEYQIKYMKNVSEKRLKEMNEMRYRIFSVSRMLLEQKNYEMSAYLLGEKDIPESIINKNNNDIR